MDYGTLRVATPDGQIREHPITVPSVVIGRADGNQVVVDHVSVSRRHAQLVIESGRITIEDLGSGTGSFVGSQRIPANTPTLVESGQTMRFGEVEARFTSAEALAGTAAAAEIPETEQTIGVSLTSPSQPLTAGSPTTATVNIQNRGNVVDELTVRIIDLPEEWVRIARPTLSLVPGARDELTVVIHPPKNSSSVAGDYPFSVAVTSKANGREVRALGKLSVQAFQGFRIELDPRRAARDFQVKVVNSGNVAMSVALAGTDEAAEFDYAFASETAELAPGEEKLVGLKVKPRKRKLLGQTTSRPFKVEARQGAGSTPSVVDGQLIIRPPLQRWKWPASIVGIMAFIGVATYQANRLGVLDRGDDGPSSSPTATAAAGASVAPPQATATPTGLYVGGNGIIANSDPVPSNTNCLAVRSAATRDAANILGRLCTGEKVAIKAGPTNADGFVWWEIQAANGLVGWAAEKSADGTVPFITPAP